MMPLTACERVQQAAHHLPPDCVAAMPYMYDIAAITVGILLRYFYTDLQAMVQAQLALYDRMGQDVTRLVRVTFILPKALDARRHVAMKSCRR